jgi:hypothetical protein
MAVIYLNIVEAQREPHVGVAGIAKLHVRELRGLAPLRTLIRLYVDRTVRDIV